MNYRHAYHAGSFTDIFKHIVLTALLKSMAHKEKAFCYLDTHAGIGKYDLAGEASQKSKEYTTGISKIILEKNPPSLIQAYLNCVHAQNNLDSCIYYPGSPLIAQHFMRNQDRMILSELHPVDHASLRKLFMNDKRIAIHHQDGYLALKAFLPPKERRGIVLIDPPYEKENDYEQLLASIPMAVSRFATGIYAIWYPIKLRNVTDIFLKKLIEKVKQPHLTIEFSIYPQDLATHLNGSGMFILNPPWQLAENLDESLAWLSKLYEHGSYSLRYN